jgi:hypothetical protein
MKLRIEESAKLPGKPRVLAIDCVQGVGDLVGREIEELPEVFVETWIRIHGRLARRRLARRQ